MDSIIVISAAEDVTIHVSCFGLCCHSLFLICVTFCQDGLRCTFMKGNERCQKKYCKACMKNRYGESVEEIVSRGAPSDVDVRAGHVSGIQYVWK